MSPRDRSRRRCILARVLRASYFALVGLGFLAYWVIADPSFDVSESQDEWGYVLAFSGVILSLAFALPLFAQVIGGRWVLRMSLVAAAGAALGSVANVFEDGLQIDWVFFVFVLGAAIELVGLLALAVVVAVGGRASRRLLALVPVGTAVAIIAFVPAGGPLMATTWLAAAVVALVLPTRSGAEPLAPASNDP